MFQNFQVVKKNKYTEEQRDENFTVDKRIFISSDRFLKQLENQHNV